LAQGTLQSLFEFQTQVALLTGMEVANASLYDGATACAEAVLMAHRITRRSKAVLSGGCTRITAEVCETYAQSFRDWRSAALRRRRDAPRISIALIDGETACVVVQNPDFFGLVRDCSALAEAATPSRRAADRRW
jgi:glycine dehydrogenase subunit 1